MHSDQCSRALNEDWIAAGCAPVLALHKERGAAAKLAELAADMSKQRAQLTPLQASLDAVTDRVAAVPAPSAPGVIELYLAHRLPWVFAVAVELCGTFGFAAAVRAPARTPQPIAPEAPPSPAAAAHRPRRPAKPGTLEGLLRGLADGSTAAPECSVLADGWIDAPQRALAKVLGTTAATVCRNIKELEAAGVLAVRAAGRKLQLRLVQ